MSANFYVSIDTLHSDESVEDTVLKMLMAAFGDHNVYVSNFDEWAMNRLGIRVDEKL